MNSKRHLLLTLVSIHITYRNILLPEEAVVQSYNFDSKKLDFSRFSTMEEPEEENIDTVIYAVKSDTLILFSEYNPAVLYNDEVEIKDVIMIYY